MLKKIVVLVVGIINIFLWADLWYKFFFNNLLTNSIYTKSDSEIAKVLYLLLLYLFCKGIVMINIGLQIIILLILIKGHLRNQPYQISKTDFKLITIKNMCILVLIGGQKQRALIAQRVTKIVVVGAIALGVVTRTPGLTGGLVVTRY